MTGSIVVQAGLGLKAQGWARHLWARAFRNRRPGLECRLGLGQGWAGLRPGLQS